MSVVPKCNDSVSIVPKCKDILLSRSANEAMSVVPRNLDIKLFSRVFLGTMDTGNHRQVSEFPPEFLSQLRKS